MAFCSDYNDVIVAYIHRAQITSHISYVESNFPDIFCRPQKFSNKGEKAKYISRNQGNSVRISRECTKSPFSLDQSYGSDKYDR